MASTADPRPLVAYYLRMGASRTLTHVCEDALKRKGADVALTLWKAVAAAREGNYAAALREVEPLRMKRDGELPSVMAARYFASKSGAESDAHTQTHAQKQAMERATVTGRLLTAQFLWLHGDADTARSLVDRVLADNSAHEGANTLRGGLEVTHTHAHTPTPALPCVGAPVTPSSTAHEEISDSPARDAELASSAARYFETALSSVPGGLRDPASIDPCLGLAVAYGTRGEVARAAEMLNDVLAHHPWFIPAGVERARVLMRMGDIDAAADMLTRVLEADPGSVEALRLAAAFTITREGNGLRAVQRLQDVVDAVNRAEPRNARLMYDISRVFARLAGRARPVLSLTITLVDAALKLDPECSAYAAELGYQRLLNGDAAGAAAAYRDAARLDESNADAVTGMISTQLMQGLVDDAEAQLEMFRMISESLGRTADVALLDAQLAWRKLGDRDAQLRLLNEAVQLHAHVAALRVPSDMSDGKSLALRDGRSPNHLDAFEFWYRVNPDFLLEIAREYLQQGTRGVGAAGSSALNGAAAHGDALDASAPAFRRGIALITTVTDVIPASMAAWLLQASAHAAASSWDGAIVALTRALDIDPGYTDAHLLLAQVGLAQGDARMAATALEQALAQNFAVQESLGYMRMKAAVLAATGKHEEAITVLEAAMRMPGVRTAATAPAGGGRGRGTAASTRDISGAGAQVPVHERASIYLLLAQSHMALDHMPEATKIVSDAMAEFAGTGEETHVTLASAQLALKRADVDGAIALLSGIPPSTPAYQGALALKADIYLKHRRDRRMYINMYQEILDRGGRSERALVDLGDAFMRVQMPEEAISAYEEALQLRPGNTQLACKIGRGLILMHDYKRAVTYYRSALAAAANAHAGQGAIDTAALRSDLTQLLVKLQRFDDARTLIDEALTATPATAKALASAAAAASSGAMDATTSATGADDIVTLRHVRKNLLLQAKVQRGAGAVDASVESLQQALAVQTRLLAVARRDGGASAAAAIDTERQEAADICMLLGEAYERSVVPPSDERAREHYRNAAGYVENYEPALLALAKLHLRRGEIEDCRKACAALTRLNPTHEEANVMLADLLFKQNDASAATYHFSALLEKKPTNYDAMSRLFTLLKRAGRVEDAGKFLKAAVRAVPAAENDPGYRFCKGLLSRYMNEPHEAIKLLNSVRLSGAWGVPATELMVDIYLSPDNDPLWSERAGEAAAASAGGAGNAEALRVAARLLDDIPPSARTMKHDVLAAYVQVASRTKGGLDDAIAKLGGILEKSPEYVPALMAIATAFMVQKQTPKARNNVKRLLKLPFDVEHTDDFVRGWLLLADTFIESGKFDQAQDALKQALELDDSCARAYEYLGAIAEREVRYAEAAELYEKAWAREANASAPVGYKLAFNYLKAGRLVESIDVCRKVLKMYPDYPKIREEVLHVARTMLRP